MSRPAILRAIVLLVLAWPSLLQAQPLVSPARYCEVVAERGQRLLAVPVADSDALRAQGLSRRDDVSSGMWFAFEQPQLLRFWMRDTWQPLSIGFIDEQGVVFQIEDMVPMTLAVHQSSRPAVAALELPQGGFAALDVVPGQRLALTQCSP